MSTAQHEPPRKTGRPAKAEADRRSASIRLSVKEALREQLEQASSVSGRSVGEEAEKRLENSFKLENVHALLFDEGPAGEFLRSLTSGLMAIHDAEISPGQKIGTIDWQTSDATRASVREMLKVLVNSLIPAPRTAEEISKIDDKPWKAERTEFYNYTLDYMKSLGHGMAKMMTGQAPEVVEALDRDGASEH